jgi:hypothetical protein
MDKSVSAANLRASLLSRLERQPVVEVGPWTRAELYEDAPRKTTSESSGPWAGPFSGRTSGA